MARQAPLTVKLNSIIDIPLLTKIVQECEHLYIWATSLKQLAFFRISKLVPRTTTSYDPLKHLAQADIFFKHPRTHFLIKLTKTLQMNNSVRLIKNPALGRSPLCLIRAIKQLLSNTLQEPNNPLFQIKYYQIPDGFLSQIPGFEKTFLHLKHRLNLSQSNISFHSL